MRSHLILITKEFPYDTKETFLEAELPVIAPKFDVVTLIATNVSNGTTQTRSVPQNVLVSNIQLGLRKSRIKDGLRGWPYLFSKNDAIRMDHERIGFSPKKRALLAYIEAKSDRIYKEIVRILSQADIRYDDQIIVYSYWFMDTARVAARLKNEFFKDRKAKAVSRAHGYDIYEYLIRSDYLPMRNWLLQNLNAVYPCSRHGEKYLKNRYPTYSSKVSTQFLGTQDHGEAKLVDSTTFSIVSCSNLIPLKRVHLIIDALSILCDEDRKINWTHIGVGPQMDGLKEKAAKKLYGSVSWQFKGFVPNKGVLDFYKNNNVDLFINVSENEGIPVSIMEATSFGIPVIATKVGGVPEIVIDGMNGVLMDKDFQPTELAEKIRDILYLSIGKYRMLRKESRILWESRYNAEINYQLFAEELIR